MTCTIHGEHGRGAITPFCEGEICIHGAMIPFCCREVAKCTCPPRTQDNFARSATIDEIPAGGPR